MSDIQRTSIAIYSQMYESIFLCLQQTCSFKVCIDTSLEIFLKVLYSLEKQTISSNEKLVVIKYQAFLTINNQLVVNCKKSNSLSIDMYSFSFYYFFVLLAIIIEHV